jgi:hypothetical protein
MPRKKWGFWRAVESRIMQTVEPLYYGVSHKTTKEEGNVCEGKGGR